MLVRSWNNLSELNGGNLTWLNLLLCASKKASRFQKHVVGFLEKLQLCRAIQTQVFLGRT